tara:strand:+ start:1050 stop:1292 length:243 start_codon:yes stop_codon:yes gene_type:complete
MCVRDADSKTEKGPETDLKMTTSQPIERARHAVKIAMLRTSKGRGVVSAATKEQIAEAKRLRGIEAARRYRERKRALRHT